MKTQNIKEQLQALKSNYKKLAQELFNSGTKELFDKHEALDSFGFTAYSPYFNDGESCKFSANIDCPYINGYQEWCNKGEGRCDSFEPREGDMFIWNKINRSEYSSTERKYVEVAGDEKLSAMVKDVNEFLASFDNDVWEEMVGNHVIVQFTREGLQIEEYSSHN
jgi:hypothetical protein